MAATLRVPVRPTGQGAVLDTLLRLWGATVLKIEGNLTLQLQAALGATPQTKQQFVYQALRAAIIRNDLPPGQRLIIEEIARQLKVSTIPVREALQQLQAERFVQIIPHAGAIVAPISYASVEETFTLLEGLESVSARTAARRLRDSGVNDLISVLHEMDSALAAGDAARWGELNITFHLAIAHLTDMPLLEEIMERVFGRWEQVQRYFFGKVLYQRVEQAQEEHHAIVRAMGEGEYERLDELVKRHNQSALAAYTAYLEQRSECGETR